MGVQQGSWRCSLLLFLQQPSHISLSEVLLIASRLASRAPVRNQCPPQTSQSLPLMQLPLLRLCKPVLSIQLVLSFEHCSILLAQRDLTQLSAGLSGYERHAEELQRLNLPALSSTLSHATPPMVRLTPIKPTRAFLCNVMVCSADGAMF